MGKDLEALESTLDHCFRDRELLSRALTHRSYASEQGGAPETHADNEQLEFLGDAILGFLVSEILVKRLPEFPEGRLSKCKAHFVSARHLHDVARRLDLGAYLLLGRGEEMSGGRAKKALLGNAVEAVIAAIYLDAGQQQARQFVVRHVMDDSDAPCNDEEGVTDFKSTLQELAQSRKLPAPHYAVVASSGPEHSKTFTVEARVGNQWSARADGASKKAASQGAAERLLAQMAEEGGGE